MIQINDLFLFYGGEFSNFYSCKFVVDDIEFNTSEQYFMYQKALFFNDIKKANEILQSKNPVKQKLLGRQVKNYSDPLWNEVRYENMLDGCRAKFTQNQRLKKILLDTNNLTIVEASPTDKIWGVGLAINNSLVLHKENWQGLNLLGEVLMELRTNLC